MWKIKHIFDGEYGCEELAPGAKAKVSVTLVNEQGEIKRISAEDNWLTEMGLDEGSFWPETTALSEKRKFKDNPEPECKSKYENTAKLTDIPKPADQSEPEHRSEFSNK